MRNTQDNRARPGSVIAAALLRGADAASVSGAVRYIASIAAAVDSLVQGARAAVGRVTGFVRGLFGRRGASGASA